MTFDYLQWSGDRKKLSIAMACDFFHPNVGGVETHIYSLSQCLIARGHRVIVITHSYGSKGQQRQGVRYMSRGLKIYYIPFLPIYQETILMTIYGTLPVIREILIREQIDIVHGHSSFSQLGSEAVLHAQGLGVPTILTDHSLFRFADFSALFLNKIFQGILGLIDAVICVSHTGKENTVLRAGFDPEQVYVIP
ncbi:putative N-acetylglucosaminyl-phosphatidylinositol biosynthetic protein, partial [Fasciola hepatica]